VTIAVSSLLASIQSAEIKRTNTIKHFLDLQWYSDQERSWKQLRMIKMVETVHWFYFYLSPDTLLVVFCKSDFTLQSISSIQAQESSKLSWPPSTRILAQNMPL